MTLNARAPDPADSDGLEAIGEAERLALRLLARREHSCLELRRKLMARGLGSSAVDGALERLLAQGAVNEARLAEHYVAERVGKGFGPLRIRGELREKGLDATLIDRYLEPMSEEWPSCLARVHDRRFGPEPPTDRADYAKRARFLEQRGFTPDSIRRLLRFHD